MAEHTGALSKACANYSCEPVKAVISLVQWMWRW